MAAKSGYTTVHHFPTVCMLHSELTEEEEGQITVAQGRNKGRTAQMPQIIEFRPQRILVNQGIGATKVSDSACIHGTMMENGSGHVRGVEWTVANAGYFVAVILERTVIKSTPRFESIGSADDPLFLHFLRPRIVVFSPIVTAAIVSIIGMGMVVMDGAVEDSDEIVTVRILLAFHLAHFLVVRRHSPVQYRIKVEIA